MCSALHEEWEAMQRMRDCDDIAIIGSKLPRDPMPIEVLFAELDGHLRQPYRPFGCSPPMADQSGSES